MTNDDKQALIDFAHGVMMSEDSWPKQVVYISRIAIATLTAEPVAWRHDEGPFGPVATCHKNAAENWLANGFNLKELFQTPPAPLPAIPDGWKLVPVEPTWEMLSANGCVKHHDGQECSHHENRKRIWRAMLAAAPSPVSLNEKGHPEVAS